MSDLADLLPCPFCGGAPTADDDMGIIICTNDDCVGPSIHCASIGEAAVFWNTRAPGQPTEPSAAHPECEYCKRAHDHRLACPEYAEYRRSPPVGSEP